MISVMSIQESRDLAKAVQVLTPKQKADFYYYTLVENEEPKKVMKRIKNGAEQSTEVKHHGEFIVKVLGTPIGGVADFDGDGDGFRTGPGGEDNIPYTPPVDELVSLFKKVFNKVRNLRSDESATVNKLESRTPSNEQQRSLKAAQNILKAHAEIYERYTNKFGDLTKNENAVKALKSVYPNLGDSERALEDGEIARAFDNEPPTPADMGLFLTLLRRGEERPDVASLLRGISRRGDRNAAVKYDGVAGIISDGIKSIKDDQQRPMMYSYLDFPPDLSVDGADISNMNKRLWGIEREFLLPLEQLGMSDDQLDYLYGAYVADHEFVHAEHYYTWLTSQKFVIEPKTKSDVARNLLILQNLQKEATVGAKNPNFNITDADIKEMEEFIAQGIGVVKEAMKKLPDEAMPAFNVPSIRDVLNGDLLDKYGRENIPDDILWIMAANRLVTHFISNDAYGNAFVNKNGDRDSILGVIRDPNSYQWSLWFDNINRNMMSLIFGDRGRRMVRTSPYAGVNFSEWVAEQRAADKIGLTPPHEELVDAWRKMSSWIEKKEAKRDNVHEHSGLSFSKTGAIEISLCSGLASATPRKENKNQQYSVDETKESKVLLDAIASLVRRVYRRGKRIAKKLKRKTGDDMSVYNQRVAEFYLVQSNAVDIKGESPYTNNALRERIKARVMAGSEGGRPGQWSARKAQLVAVRYRKAGGGYKKGKSPNKKQRSLKKWTREKWRTSDGKPALRGGKMRRYLPDKVWGRLTPAQRAATNRKKIEGDKRGRQFVANTTIAERRAASYRNRKK